FLEGWFYYDIAQTLYENEHYEDAAVYSKKAADLHVPYSDYDFGQESLKLYIQALDKLERAKHSGIPSGPDIQAALDALLKDGRNVRDGEWFYRERAAIRMQVRHDPRGAQEDLSQVR